MLNAALYRAAFLPFAVALAIAAFSLTSRPAPLTSALAPDAFQGRQALAETEQLAAEYPRRSPASTGDERLAAHVASAIEGLGSAAGGGFSVRTVRARADTLAGERLLTTVIAQRPGSTAESPIVILAHRDSTDLGSTESPIGQRGAAAQLSGTGALIELARVFAARETRRTIVLVSTSGGSGGDAGAGALVGGALGGGLDATIVLGDLASTGSTGTPIVVPYSDSYGQAPDELQRTLLAAIAAETPLHPPLPSTIGQLAHYAFPLAAGEEGVLNAGGAPSVLVQASGEREPPANAPLSAERLEGLGRAVLGAVDALDAAPDIESTPQDGLVLAHQIVPAWALRLLILTLLLPPAVVLIDGLARARRRGEPLARWAALTAVCALPFFVAAAFARLIGALGAIPAPGAPVLGSALSFGGEAFTAVLACIAVFGLAWLALPPLARRLGLVAPLDPAAEDAQRSDAAGIATLLVLLIVACIAWVLDPYTALLIVPALHLLLPIASPERRPRPLAGLALIVLALVPLALLMAFYAHELGYGAGLFAWSAVLLLAGGHVGLLAAALWSVAGGCFVAIARLALTPPADPVGGGAGFDEHGEITIRGPLSYAGPGSLGGTGSALRR
jgi:hypothetical protein